jgi:hypothetical protein
MGFTVGQFQPTQWATAEEKAKLANQLVRFIERDFERRLYTKALYNRLRLMFGHIAEYDMNGFWAVWFADTRRQLGFVDNLLGYRSYGDPTWTWSDVERAVQEWARGSGIRERLATHLRAEVEARERAELARLRQKYEVA